VEALKSAATELEHGEMRHLAGYLGQLTATQDPALSAERLRQLGVLMGVADAPSGDRLYVARVLAGVYWAEKRLDAAIDLLASAFTEGRAQTDPRAQAELQATLDLRITWTAERGMFQQAEALVENAQKAAGSTVEREQWSVRLAALWAQGLAKGGAFRIGRGQALYREALTRVEAAWGALPTLGEQFHQSHAALARAANERREGGDVAAERVRFAKERLPALLKGYPNQVTERVEFEAGVLDKLAGPRASLVCVLDRMDVEPSWYARLDQDIWTQTEWALAEQRGRRAPGGRSTAPAREGRAHRPCGARAARWPPSASGNNHFWAAVCGHARGAAQQKPRRRQRQQACAHHLVMGALRGHRRPDGRRRARPPNARRAPGAALAAAGPALQPHSYVDRLLKVTPENLALHKQRASAFMGLGRPADAEAALRGGLEHAAGAKPPDAGLLGDVGQAAEEMGLHAPAAAWLRDALTKAEQAGGWRHRWMDWRRHLALALAGLDRIDDAVEVAAVIAVGDRSPQRGTIGPIDDGDMPEAVLLRAKDLVGYATRFEAQVAKTGAEVPVIRKALARVFRQRNDAANAIRHLEALRAVVPDDVVVLRALVELYDASAKPDEARLALDALVAFDPGNAGAWEDLGRRLAKTGDAEGAERAFTNAVEMRPLEPDGYRLLARLAVEAKTPARAAAHWHNVTRVRPLEPEGRLEEAKAWIAAGEPAQARAPLGEILAGTWEERFGPTKEEAGRLLKDLR
jgi:tetratricopeptide (TPR) repeat protein